MKPDNSGGSAQTPHPFRHCLLEFIAGLTDHRPLGVAVSGGSDSLGLLYGLATVVPPQKLVALTVDHGLRSASSDEARWVKSRCRRLGIRHETLLWDGGKPATGLQAAARAARYRLLAAASQRLGLAAVLTAHTSDDQNETLTMRRARSSSHDAPGLAGIPAATLFEGRMWVLRPLLRVSRGEIRTFLREAGIVDWVEDPSNADTRFERVRVRVRSQLADQSPETAGPEAANIALARFQLASRAAEFMDARCHIDSNGLVWMNCSRDDDVDAATAALEAVIDWCGGASRPLDRRGKATLAALVASAAVGSAGGTTSLGRTLIRHTDSSLSVRRERRDIPKLVLEPGTGGVWDRRFGVHNLSQSSLLTVSGGGNDGVWPCFSREPGHWAADLGMEDGVIGGFVCQSVAGRNSQILPVYQLPLAQAVARLAKLKPFPECPWGNSPDIPALTAMKVQ